MPLTALTLESRLMPEVAPGDPERFYEILSEADERLLDAGKWQWTRAPLDLVPVDGIVTLPEGYASIVGCKIGSMAAGVLWQEIEYLDGGPGAIPIEGLNGQLLDLGVIEGQRQYRCTGSAPEAIVVLARYAHIPVTALDDSPRCQSFPALKQAMLAVNAENNQDLERSVAFMRLAVQTLDLQEAAHRGAARKVFDPKIYGPPRRRSSHNFP